MERVLPMPGGPEIRTACALGFGAGLYVKPARKNVGLFLISFLLPRITTSSKSLSHLIILASCPSLPTKS